ncbi:hypothetical protein EDB86DRAFT_2908524 [Lactarius hatsudake]|nr:hypothetical protein EDB86DRAFT_3005982 [Lactarius hatsudake]KAH8999937.1 hypothetical protein EDB86DRAFT_2908524 [Lactarius hatsudake]
MPIFEGIKFFCSSTLSENRRLDLISSLERNGAESVPLEEATHIITHSLDYEGQDRAKGGSVTVTDYWAERSLILGRLQLVQHFSPDPSMLFSGVVACATDLVPSDVEVLSAGITALGGQWRAGLTRDVTHLFAVAPGSDKYQTALRYQKDTQVKVLLPHWFDDSVRLGICGLSTTAYEWPEPPLFTFGRPSPGMAGDSLLRPHNKPSEEKKALYKAALMTAEQEVKLGQAEPRNVWDHRHVLLSPDLELSDDRRQAIEAGIVRSGGVVVECDARRIDVDHDFDVLIARYRWGGLYVQGVSGRKLIGSLTWLFHVESTGIIGTPTAQLLHYPVPKKPIEGFSAHEITVTNYTGDARDYLKKLIGLMGATFTPSMSGKNTVLIAAYFSGNKANKARNWSIPIVNHTWLEDCFIQWKNLTVGLEKYVVFPPGLNFSDNLGERGIQREVILESLPDLETEMAHARSAVTPVAEVSNNDDGGKQSPTYAKRPSTRKANETEDATGGLDSEDRINVNVKSQSTNTRRGNVHMQVDEPEGAAPHEPGEHHEPKRTWKSPRRASASHSPLRQATSPLKPAHKRISSPSKRRRGADQETTEDEDEPSPTKRSTRAELAAAGSLVNSPSKAPQKSPSKSSPGSPLLRMESVLMPPMGTGEALAKSSQRAAKTGSVKDKLQSRNPQARSISPERVCPLSSLTVDTTMDREEGPSRQVSRRSAASRASQRLREEVMPDVVNFEKEMRRGHVRVANLPESSKGKEKTDTGSKTVGKGKKRASVHNGVEGTLFSDDEHERKKRRISGTKDRSTGAGRADDGDERSDRAGAGSQGTAEISSGKGAKPKKAPPGGDLTREYTVRVLATQVTLEDNEERALAKLGAKIGVKPGECTHLVVKSLARTEKLLCAMAVAPHFVTERWVRDSITAKKLLPTDKYVLADRISEMKWKFELVDALKRAKANRGQLFAGKVFYVTNNVPLDKKLLKNVILAHGGQIRQQNPTVRALSGKSSGQQHFVISCAEDASVWRPIAEAGHAIYSQELVLSAALTQEMRLYDEEFRVDTPS